MMRQELREQQSRARELKTQLIRKIEQREEEDNNADAELDALLKERKSK